MTYKKTTGLLLLIIVLGVLLFIKNAKAPEVKSATSFDAKNATYNIDNTVVTLYDGLSELSIPNSSAKVITRYFGNNAQGDLTNDGKDDVAFLLSQETGGSGIFYYAVVAIQMGNGYKTTNAFFLGDRIAPQTTEIRAGKLYVNYAERKSSDPMTTQPSIGTTKYLEIDSRQSLVEAIR